MDASPVGTLSAWVATWDIVTGDREPSRVVVEAGKDVCADVGVYHGSVGRKGSLCARGAALKLASRWLWCDSVVTYVPWPSLVILLIYPLRSSANKPPFSSLPHWSHQARGGAGMGTQRASEF